MLHRPNFQILDSRSDFMDVAGELVAHDEVCAGWLVATEDMKFTGHICLELNGVSSDFKRTFHIKRSTMR
jgi:hypothetical protein